MKQIKVEPLAIHQYMIKDAINDTIRFQSYDTTIAYKTHTEFILDYRWTCSRTTIKYTLIFVKLYFGDIETQKDIKQAIKDNRIKIQDLN